MDDHVTMDASLRRAFQHALRKDDIDALKIALADLEAAWGDDVTSGFAMTKQGKTIAHDAAGQGAIRCLEYLIARDMERDSADFLGRDKRQFQLIHYAAEKNARGSVKWLVEHGYGTATDYIGTYGFPFLVAIKRGAAEAAIELLRCGAPRAFSIVNNTDASCYDLETVLRDCPDKALLAVYLPSQTERDEALVEATRLGLRNAVPVLLDLGARPQIPLTKEALTEYAIDDIRRQLASVVRMEAEKANSRRLLNDHRGMEDLLATGPLELLSTALAEGMPVDHVLRIAAKRESTREMRLLLEQMDVATVRARSDLRRLASTSPEAIEYLVSLGFDSNERFAVHNVAGRAAIKSRISYLLSIVKSSPAGVDGPLKRIVELAPAGERAAYANEALWKANMNLEPATIDFLLDEGGAQLWREARDGERSPLVLDWLSSKRFRSYNFGDTWRALAHVIRRGGECDRAMMNSALSALVEVPNEGADQAIAVFQALFSKGGKLSTVDINGKDALFVVCGTNWLDPASESTKDNWEDRSPLLGFLIRSALNEGMTFAACGPEGTVLHAYARQKGSLPLELLELMVANGLDITATDDNGRTAMDYVSSWKPESAIAIWKETFRRHRERAARASVATRRAAAPRRGL